MTPTAQGILALLFIVTGLPFSSIPEQPVVSACLVLGILWVEGKGFLLGQNYRFSPASPILLAAAMSSNIGIIPATLALVFLVLSQSDEKLIVALGQRLSLSLSLALSAGALFFIKNNFAVVSISIATFYLASRLLLDAKLERPSQREQRAIWRQVNLQIRPLEFALAVSAVPLAYLLNFNPWLALLILPLFWVLHPAAENILLNSNNKVVAQALRSLRDAKERERVVAKELSQAKRDKALLENFARHISSEPTLLDASQALVATVKELIEVDNVIVFLSDPPEPFYYQVESDLLPKLQAHSLLQLTEPAALQAMERTKVVTLPPTPGQDRLLSADSFATAVPLEKLGVLCVGSDAPLPAQTMKQLEWLSGKAALALATAYQNHLKNLNQRKTEQKVQTLTERVEHLSALVRGAEKMASSLDPPEIRGRFVALLKETVPNDGGYYVENDGEIITWGHQISIPDPIRNEVIQRQSALIINDKTRLQQISQSPISSVVISSLSAGRDTIAVVALVNKSSSYTEGLRDQLFILASQSAMARSNARLFQQVLQAREELEESQARLIQSSKMTAMGQLSAGVAHELNSPIGAISICLDEAKDMFDSHPDLAKRLLDKGQAAVERARVIVDRLLAYCRIDSIEYTEIDLIELVEDTIDFLSYQLKETGLSVEGKPDGSPLLIAGDYGALQQVFTNLLVNAHHSLDTTSKVESQIRVQFEETPQHTVVRVRDNGSGISEENLTRIFDPFFTTKETGDGTGLGLWASHQIVERHGGEIEVDTKLGEGSTFSVLLPKETPAKDC